MARYTQESIERVRDAVDFAELVGARTELKRAGANRLQGLCPFHDERTPSFGINPVEKVYYCFGCSAGGDVFRFVMETESLDFASALDWLAERYRVPLERESEDPREAEQRQARERLLALMERTAAYYVRVLWESDEGTIAREYLAGRGLQESALREYRVGFAPDSWDRVVNASSRAGYTAGELEATGIGQRARNGRMIDRFRGRITFPLADHRGRVLGFGARAMRPDDTPKYLNTSESRLFHKSEVVYGADLARASAAKAGRVVIVEGYTDVIALRQAGIPEAVATMGTAITESQMSVIARLAPRALFCQDPDAAGQSSVEKGLEALAAFNAALKGSKVDQRIVRMPSGEDPADIVQRGGNEAIQALLDRAVPLERFRVERLLELGEIVSAEGRDAILQQVRSVIGPLGAGLLREELVDLVSNRLGLKENLVNQLLSQPPAAAGSAGDQSSSMQTPGGSDDWVRRNERFRPGGSRQGGRWDARRRQFPPPPPEPVDPQAALLRQEKSEQMFLAYCLALPEEGERRLAEIDVDAYFSSASTREAAAYLRGRVRTPSAALPSGNESLARVVASIVIRAGELEATLPKLELEALQLDLHRHDRLIADARTSGATGVTALAAERQRILDAIRHRLT